MVATAERGTIPNLREGGFTLADLPIVAVGYTIRDNAGNVAETDYKGLAGDLAKRKNMPVEDLLGHFRTTLDFVSLLAPEEETPVPVKLEHLITVWDVTFQLANEGYFDSEGNIGEIEPRTLFEKVAARRGRTEKEMLEHVAGSRRFLSEFIASNTR